MNLIVFRCWEIWSYFRRDDLKVDVNIKDLDPRSCLWTKPSFSTNATWGRSSICLSFSADVNFFRFRQCEETWHRLDLCWEHAICCGWPRWSIIWFINLRAQASVASIWNCFKYKKFLCGPHAYEKYKSGWILSWHWTAACLALSGQPMGRHLRKFWDRPMCFLMTCFLQILTSVEQSLEPKADEIWWCLGDFWIFSVIGHDWGKQVTYGQCLWFWEDLSSIDLHCKHGCTYASIKNPLYKSKSSKQCKVNHSCSLSSLNGVAKKCMT